LDTPISFYIKISCAAATFVAFLHAFLTLLLISYFLWIHPFTDICIVSKGWNILWIPIRWFIDLILNGHERDKNDNILLNELRYFDSFLSLADKIVSKAASNRSFNLAVSLLKTSFCFYKSCLPISNKLVPSLIPLPLSHDSHDSACRCFMSSFASSLAKDTCTRSIDIRHLSFFFLPAAWIFFFLLASCTSCLSMIRSCIIVGTGISGISYWTTGEGWCSWVPFDDRLFPSLWQCRHCRLSLIHPLFFVVVVVVFVIVSFECSYL